MLVSSMFKQRSHPLLQYGQGLSSTADEGATDDPRLAGERRFLSGPIDSARRLAAGGELPSARSRRGCGAELISRFGRVCGGGSELFLLRN